MTIEAIGVVGAIGHLGGANTELGHQVTCWLRMGLQVQMVSAHPLDQHAREVAAEYQRAGCIYHEPAHWAALEGLHTIAFCNKNFLEQLPAIRQYARSTSFVNCMTWNFPLEIQRQGAGLIDFHLYQTPHAMERVGAKLKDLGTFRPLLFTPYFDAGPFPFIDPAGRARDFFRFGRISRGDADKHGTEQLWIYETMTAPALKQGVILGWDQRAEKKFGRRPPPWVATYPERGMTQQQFYQHCDAVVMTTDTFENLPRVGFEAMASGSVLVVDHRGGWLMQVDDGRTGWLCRDQREFVYKASRCAFEHAERAAMAHAARQKVLEGWGFQAAADSWAQVFAAWQRLDQGQAPSLAAKGPSAALNSVELLA